MSRRIFKYLLRFIFWLFISFLAVFFIIYALAPIYDFQQPESFSGKKIHNPYAGLDSTAWKKGNFQVQSRVWLGITDGHKNDSKAIWAIYGQLGYDIITITDYMKINTFGQDLDGYVSAYEHGYGLRKTHQVCIGTERVTWLDYPFYQNLNHKQHIINRLRNRNEIVSIVHPRVRHGYVPEDMKLLTNYDLLEAVSHYVVSLDYWDAALSTGHPVYILSNDDSHDVLNPTKVGRYCTFVNSESLAQTDIISALKSGKAFGAKINMLEGDDFLKKAEDHSKIPILKSVEVKEDTLFVEVSKKARAFTFFGQNGIIKKSVVNSDKAFYPVASDDSYIRTEIIFENNTQFFLNPVIRHDGDAPPLPSPPQINLVKTWLQRFIAFMIVAIIVFMVMKLRKPQSNKGHVHSRQYFYE